MEREFCRPLSVRNLLAIALTLLFLVGPSMEPIQTPLLAQGNNCTCATEMQAYDENNNWLGSLNNSYSMFQPNRGACAFACLDWNNAWSAAACTVHTNVKWFDRNFAGYLWGSDWFPIEIGIYSCY